tara:strand:- start:179 stop:382 length:204 start_codon:yes stop_codon:yes gene_type:complete
MKKKIKAYEAIGVTIQSVFDNPDIEPRDRRKIIAATLEPMLNEVFGRDYEPEQWLDIYRKDAPEQEP